MSSLNKFLSWFFLDFGLAMALLALLLIIIDLFIYAFTRRGNASTIVYRWTTLLPVGITALYAAFMHAYYPNFTATTIGWPDSPFQFEVAAANLGFGIIAILSFHASYGFRLANVIGITFWLWGDAIVHLYELFSKNNFTVGNAGSWLWLDILLPIILIICIINMRVREKRIF